MKLRAALSRFLDGLRQPLVLARATLQDPVARAHYKRVMIVQVSITAVVGVVIAVGWVALMRLAAHTPGLEIGFSQQGFRIHTSGDGGPPVPESEKWTFDDPVQMAVAFA